MDLLFSHSSMGHRTEVTMAFKGTFYSKQYVEELSNSK